MPHKSGTCLPHWLPAIPYLCVFALARSRSLVVILGVNSKVGERGSAIDTGRSRTRMGEARSLELRVVSPPSYSVAGMFVGTTSSSSASSVKSFCLCLTRWHLGDMVRMLMGSTNSISLHLNVKTLQNNISVCTCVYIYKYYVDINIKYTISILYVHISLYLHFDSWLDAFVMLIMLCVNFQILLDAAPWPKDIDKEDQNETRECGDQA